MAKAPKPTAVPKTHVDEVAAQINKRLEGRGNVFTGSTLRDDIYERRSTGIPSLDYILHGGYAKGGVHEFGGEYSSCKTSIAIEALAENQRTENGGVAWIALEPFSKSYARKRGFFLPFSEEEVLNPNTGLMQPIDPFSRATALEKWHMEQAGITDPYEKKTDFLLVKESRGDVALDCAVDCIRSNAFAYVVVDSFGVAKSTKWVDESEVQDAGDFPREPKMIGDYTTKVLLAMNGRYDENNRLAKDGTEPNQTTVIHLNQIITVIGTQARAKHKTQAIKGGEGNKHNHHAIVFLSKGPDLEVDDVHGKKYRYARPIRAITLKSKLGPDGLDSEFDYYLRDYGGVRAHAFDRVKDVATFATMRGIVQQSGSTYEMEGHKFRGKEQYYTFLRENPDWFAWLYGEVRETFYQR